MTEEPTTAEKIRKLPWAYVASAANTIFTQFTFFGPVFVLFLSALGLSKTGIGVLLSFFPFFGLTALFTAPAVARFGYKRTYLTFWTLRKVVTAGLLLTPWVLAAFGVAAATSYVAVIVAGFAVCRAVGETGNYPWVQEYVPSTVRGQYSATENRIITVLSIIAVLVAGAVVARASGLNGFMALIAAGVVFGLASIWASSHLPGGQPLRGAAGEQVRHRQLLAPARDPNFRTYLLAGALITIGTGPLGSFLPLFMQEQVGLSDSQVVWLSTGGQLGGLLASYLWGWAADRYGSRPVMLLGLALIAARPLFWMMMPRDTELSFAVAFAISFVSGAIGLGWGIGSTRLLFVSLVPPEKKTEYMALHYAWMGLVGGLSAALGGRLLDLTSGLTGRFFIFVIDPYTILFVAGILLPAAAALLLRRLSLDSRVSVGEFASMFFHGNPLLAAESLIRYGRARNEEAAVTVTERLGQARSPLTVEELLESLADPRFNVRFEAVLAMARMPADPRLIEALGEIINGPEPALSVIAAWALGRMGDGRAVPALRAGLASPYRSVQAHSARALGTVRDSDSVDALRVRFEQERDHSLRMAYASALGKLRAAEAAEPLLRFLYQTENANARLELALALVRLVDAEADFIQLHRQTRPEAGTALSQAASGLKRRLSRLNGAGAELAELAEASAQAFAHQDLAQGALLLGRLIQQLPTNGLSAPAATILEECARRLAECQASRLEYVLLALNALRELGNGH